MLTACLRPSELSLAREQSMIVHAHADSSAWRSSKDVPDPGGWRPEIGVAKGEASGSCGTCFAGLAGFDLRPGFLCGARSDRCSDTELCFCSSVRVPSAVHRAAGTTGNKATHPRLRKAPLPMLPEPLAKNRASNTLAQQNFCLSRLE